MNDFIKSFYGDVNKIAQPQKIYPSINRYWNQLKKHYVNQKSNISASSRRM